MILFNSSMFCMGGVKFLRRLCLSARPTQTPLSQPHQQHRFFSSVPKVRSNTNKHLSSRAMSTETPENGAAATQPISTEKTLPQLTASEFRQYNRLAEFMDYYHNHFRSTWTLMLTACEKNKRPDGMSIRQFIQVGQQLCSQLNMHHGIEEAHLFPVLAKKMPAFQKELHLLTQHKEIHKGLGRLDKYLEACRTGEQELRMNELKDVLDSFGTVLWQHLDDEVAQLGAENMRKFWTLEEMRKMPM